MAKKPKTVEYVTRGICPACPLSSCRYGAGTPGIIEYPDEEVYPDE